MRTLFLGILAVLVLWGVIGMYFGNQQQYPYRGAVVGVHNAFGRCIITIERDGPKMGKELLLSPRPCGDDLKPGVTTVEVVSNKTWSLSIPSLLP